MGTHRYRLQARRFEGSLAAPVRNELETAEGDDREALERLAVELSARGFRVWLYQRRPVPGRLSGSSELTVVREWLPE